MLPDARANNVIEAIRSIRASAALFARKHQAPTATLAVNMTGHSRSDESPMQNDAPVSATLQHATFCFEIAGRWGGTLAGEVSCDD
jgi:hypothetical protein